jgi:carboxymethylenebutenolidase
VNNPRSSDLTYTSGNYEFKGFLAMPSGRPASGVIILHSWWGLTPFFREICSQLAAEGFAAFSPDLNNGKVAGTIEEAKTLMAERDYEQTKAAVIGAVEALQNQMQAAGHPSGSEPAQPLGVIGFSMGASWALDLASKLPDLIACVVLYYGVEGVDFSKVQASILGHFAESDNWTPVQWAQQMEADMQEAGLETRFYSYPDAGHWFCEADRPEAYLPGAAQLAWERTLQFLHEKLDAQQQAG